MSSKTHMIISISGIDCAGKSTQIALLKERVTLQKARKSAVIIWYRPGYSQTVDRLRSLVRRRMPRILPTSADIKRRRNAFGRRGVSEAWIIMALVDCFFQYAVRVRWLSWCGRTVICDRYTWDALIDLDLRFPGMNSWLRRILCGVLKLCPQPKHSILLMISPGEIEARAKKKNEPFPDSESVRSERIKRYMELADSGRLLVIDGTANPGDVNDQILRILNWSEPRERAA